MKKAFLYSRTSTDEQSNWSISGQVDAARAYCERRGWEVAGVFVDEGQSGKSFDRPAWKEMTGRLKHDRPDFIVTIKYDRVSRQTTEGLGMMERLEKRFNLRFISAMEDVQVNPHSPFFFKIRADMMVNAEFERRVIIDRTMFGRVAGAKQGRFLGLAPLGYDNARDQHGKPVIVVNDEEAPIIRAIYADYLAGFGMEEIRRRARVLGFRQTKKDAILKILRNATYAGFVNVPAHAGEAGSILRGIHAPIIDEATYWQVQDRLSARKAPAMKSDLHPAFPLRGVLACEVCHQGLTGCFSRGRHGGRWGYYYCHRHKPAPSFRADTVEREVVELLNSLSLEDWEIRFIGREAERLTEEGQEANRRRRADLEKSIADTAEKLNALEEKYIVGKVSDDVYRRWSGTWHREQSAARQELDDLTSDQSAIWHIFVEGLPVLGRIGTEYDLAIVEVKREIIRQLFPLGIEKTVFGFRTPQILPAFAHNLRKTKLLTIEKNRETSHISGSFPFRDKEGEIFKPLIRLVSLLTNQKAA